MTEQRTIDPLAKFEGVYYVGWRQVDDAEGTKEWVLMRSGAGELGWWHRHTDEPKDFGSNPVDFSRMGKQCRTCGKEMP